MMLVELMQKSINEEREIIIYDGYNNLYRLEYSKRDNDCYMYEHYSSLRTEIAIEVTFDIINNPYYEELEEMN